MIDYVKGTDCVEADRSKPVIMWAYPGQKSDAVFDYGDVTDYVSKTYTDENGLVWGYVVYYMGMRQVWVCLTDPYSENPGNISGENTDTADGTHPASDEDSQGSTVSVNGIHIPLKADPTPEEKIPRSNGNTQTLKTVCILIGGVILATAAVIIALFPLKPKKKSTK